jgi:hypothetical protein
MRERNRKKERETKRETKRETEREKGRHLYVDRERKTLIQIERQHPDPCDPR